MVRLYSRENSPYWYAEIDTPDGKTKRISTGVPRGNKNRAKALEAAEAKRSELTKNHQSETFMSLQDLWYYWVSNQKHVKSSSVKTYRNRIVVVIYILKNPSIVDITPAVVRNYIKEVRSTGRYTDELIRGQLTVLSSIIDWAIDNELPGMPETNPVRLVNKRHLKSAPRSSRALSPDQIRAIWKVIRDPEQCMSTGLDDFVTVLLDTGMRSEEVLGLEWNEVDLTVGVIRLSAHREKTKRGRLIPITSTVREIILRQKRYPDCPFVFVNPHTRMRYRSFRPTWKKMCKRAGVPPARLHDLRHTFATHLRHSGVRREDRMTIVGHSSEDTHAGYANPSLDVINNTVEKHRPSTLLTHLPKR